MNKQRANILFGLCLALSVFVTYKAISYAGDLAYSGKQPVLWINLAAFFVAVGLVLVGIVIKSKSK